LINTEALTSTGDAAARDRTGDDLHLLAAVDRLTAENSLLPQVCLRHHWALKLDLNIFQSIVATNSAAQCLQTQLCVPEFVATVARITFHRPSTVSFPMPQANL
jgi:hypothetical protein